MARSNKFRFRLPKVLDGMNLEDLEDDDPSKYGHRRFISLDPTKRNSSMGSSAVITSATLSGEILPESQGRKFPKFKPKSNDFSFQSKSPFIIPDRITKTPTIRSKAFSSDFTSFMPSMGDLRPVGEPVVSVGVGTEGTKTSDLLRESLSLNIREMAVDKKGYRELEKKIEEDPRFWCREILTRLGDDLFFVSQNMFGNFLIQKLIEKGSTEDRWFILSRITQEECTRLGNSKYGTRVLQALIAAVGKNGEINFQHILMDKIIGSLMDLQSDLRGNYVISQCLMSFHRSISKRLLDRIIERAVEITLDRQGCCLMQKVIDLESENREFLHTLGAVLGRNVKKIINAPYGNYVLQVLIERGLLDSETIRQISNEVYTYSKLKFSSNVIEKILKVRGNGQLEFKEELVMSISRLTREQLEDLVMDRFGNYVIQSMLAMWRVDQNLFSQSTADAMAELKEVISSIVYERLGRFKKPRNWLLNIRDLL